MNNMISPETTSPPEPVFEYGWLLLPVITALAGVWAYGGRTHNPQALIAVTALILGGWLPFWRTLIRTRWADPLHSWRTWTRQEPLKPLPYTQPESPGARLHATLEQALAWWQDMGKAALARPLQNALLTAVVSILISLYIGRGAVMLSLMFISLTELAVLWHGGHGRVSPIWTAACTASLPWILGTLAGSANGFEPYLAALSLGLLISLFAWASPAAIIGPLTAAAFFTWQGAPPAAMWVVVLGLPGYVLLVQRPSALDHRRAIGPWLLLMVLVYAVVL